MTRQVPIHPVYAAALDARKDAPPLYKVNLVEFRKAVNTACAALKVPDVIEEDRTVEMSGRTLRLTLLRPLGTEHEMLPVMVFYHGGAWVVGSKYVVAKLTRELCIQNRIAIVVPDYSLAPEVKFPVIHEECFATLEWVLANGNDVQIDISKLAVCGDSAGGNLAATIPLMAKQRGLPADTIKAQIPLYPSTTTTYEHYPSFQTFGKGDYTFTADELRWASQIYYEGVPNSGDKKWFSPLQASLEDLRDLPPALVIVAECDVLRDQGEEYARKLTEAGVATTAMRVIGATHGFLTEYAATPAYTSSLAMIKHHLDQAFGRL